MNLISPAFDVLECDTADLSLKKTSLCIQDLLLGNDQEVEFHEVEIRFFHEIEITIMSSKLDWIMRSN
jgi:hypothetical protein